MANASSFQNRGAAMNTKIVSDAPNEEKLVDATEQANEVSQLAAAGKGGLCAPPVLTSDQRLIVTPYSTIRFAFSYLGASGIATPVATQLTAFSWGYQDPPGAAGILAAEAGRILTSADSDGYVHDTYPFLCKGITFAPKGLVHASPTAAAAGSNTPVADGDALHPSVNYNFSDTDLSLLYDSFINSTFMSFVLQGETCELLLGLNHLFPAGIGPKGGAFVTNGEPLADSFRYLPYYVIFPAGVRQRKSMTVRFDVEDPQSVQLNQAIYGDDNRVIYIDVLVVLYGRLMCELAGLITDGIALGMARRQ